MPNGDFHDMTDREILVKLATSQDYLDKRIDSMSKDTKEHIESLRIVINNCNALHCDKEKELEKSVKVIEGKVDGVERKVWGYTSIIGAFIFGITFLKDEIISFILRR